MALFAPVSALRASARTAPVSACTIVSPERHATVVVRIANAPDFCDLVSQALAAEVFRSAAGSIPAVLVDSPMSALSCVLAFRRT
ncbi:MAG: hypothetical protein ACTHKS_12605, partial [Gaiellaceae bacterium]